MNNDLDIRLPQRTLNPVFKKSDRIFSISECQYCGFTHTYGKGPAYEKVCAKRKSKNHFARVCKKVKPPISDITPDLSEGDFETLETFCLNEVYISRKFWYTATIEVRVYPIVFKIDTGAACNVIEIPQFKKLGMNCNNLSQSKVVWRSFSKNKIPIIGKFLISCFYKGCKVK